MASITLKNVPDELRLRLKREAKANGRSLQQEILMRLRREPGEPDDLSITKEVAAVRAMRERQRAAGVWLGEDEVLDWSGGHRN